MNPTPRNRPAVERMRLVTPRALAAPVEPMDWLITGVWPTNSHGPFGGDKKTLKSMAAMLHSLAIATGQPSFGHESWTVPERRAVLYLCGEGGQALAQRRLQRYADEVYGVTMDQTRLYLVEGVTPLDHKDFQVAVQQFCKRVRPGLVVLDPLYAYHPANVEVANLYQRGAMLAALAQRVREAAPGAAFWVVDHFNKTGSGTDLNRFAQSGMAQWADSWWGAEHATTPDPDAGRFQLRVEVGSRHWGGAAYEIDVDEGPFDWESRQHLTPLKVAVSRAEGPPPSARRGGRSDTQIDELVWETVRDGEWELTKQGLVTAVGGSRDRVRERVSHLESQRVIVAEKREVTESSGRVVRRWVYGFPVETAVSTRPAREGKPDGLRRRKR